MKDILNFHGFAIRYIVEEDGEQFCLRDVCAVLGIANVGNAASALDDDEKKTVHVLDGNRGCSFRSLVSTRSCTAAARQAVQPLDPQGRPAIVSQERRMPHRRHKGRSLAFF